MLKQELARLRAGSNGSAAPAALDKGERKSHASTQKALIVPQRGQTPVNRR